ncbi:DUF4229 domain-containing protein [Leucobacter sp. GX24907]
MKQRTAWTVYIALRLVLFAAPFAVLYAIGWPWWLAAITATLVAVSLSVIFLQKPRETAAQSIYEWRNRDRTEDEIVEDEMLDDGKPTRERVGNETPGAAGIDDEATSQQAPSSGDGLGSGEDPAASGEEPPTGR